MRSSAAWISIWALALLPLVARAQAPAEPADTGSAAALVQTLDVGPGMSSLLHLPEDSVRLAVADEAVAKLTVVSERDVLVHGLAFGRTTLYAWLKSGQVLHYLVRVQRDVEALADGVKQLDPRLAVEQSPDGRQMILRGEITDRATAARALDLVNAYVQAQPEPRPAVLDLLHNARGPLPDADARLSEALHKIDPRISVRRIQVETQAKSEADTYVLEGSVSHLSDLVRAVMLSERQLGGKGSQVGAKGGDRRLSNNRQSNFTGMAGQSSGGGSGQSLEALNGQDMPPAGLASQVARGMMITSDSGRVLSFLTVDRIEEILVSIRVYEIDRGKARRAGIDYRVDSEHISLLQLNRAELAGLPAPDVARASVEQVGTANLVGSYVSDSFAALAAVDLLEEKALARSVAEPNVVTLTGEEATVLVGGEVPIPTVSANQVGTVQGFAFQSFGVRLDIRPTVDKTGIVTLEVAPSIVRPNEGLGSQGVPGFEMQTVQTVARVRSGQSLIIGGLINWEDTIQERKVPLLGDIPLLKVLFRWNHRERAEKELLFVMTPKVMEDALEGLQEEVRLPTPQIIDHMKLSEESTPAHLTESGIPSTWKSDDVPAGAAPPAALPPQEAKFTPAPAVNTETGLRSETAEPAEPAELAEPTAPALPAEMAEPAATAADGGPSAQMTKELTDAQLDVERQARTQAEAQAKADRQSRLDVLATVQAERDAANSKLAAERRARTEAEAKVEAERQAHQDAQIKALAAQEVAEAQLAREKEALAKAAAQAEAQSRAREDSLAKLQAEQQATAAKLSQEREARTRAEAQAEAQRRAQDEAGAKLQAKLQAEQQAAEAKLSQERAARAKAEAQAASERKAHAEAMAAIEAERVAAATPPPPASAATQERTATARGERAPRPPVDEPAAAAPAAIAAPESEAATWSPAAAETSAGATPGRILPASASTGTLFHLDGTTRPPSPSGSGDSVFDWVRRVFHGKNATQD